MRPPMTYRSTIAWLRIKVGHPRQDHDVWHQTGSLSNQQRTAEQAELHSSNACDHTRSRTREPTATSRIPGTFSRISSIDTFNCALLIHKTSTPVVPADGNCSAGRPVAVCENAPWFGSRPRWTPPRASSKRCPDLSSEVFGTQRVQSCGFVAQGSTYCAG